MGGQEALGLGEAGYRYYIGIAVRGMPQWRGRTGNEKPRGTSAIISHGYDFINGIEGKSQLVALA